MTTRTQNSGAGIKNQISATGPHTSIPLEDLFCERDKEMTETNVPEEKRPALQALAAYTRRQSEIAYAGTLSEAVYFFMGGHMWTDSLHEYRNTALSMLAALTDTDFNNQVKEKIGHCAKLDLVSLLEHTISFMRDLESNAFRPLLIMQEIVNRDMTQEQLDQIAGEYEARLEMSLSGRYKRA